MLKLNERLMRSARIWMRTPASTVIGVFDCAYIVREKQRLKLFIAGQMSKQCRGTFPRHLVRTRSRELGKTPVLFSPARYPVAVDGPKRFKRQSDRPQVIFPARVTVARKRKSTGRRREGHDHARRARPSIAP